MVSVKGTYRSTIEPAAQKQRKVPFHLQEILEKTIDELIVLDIVEKVSKPTGWVYPH